MANRRCYWRYIQIAENGIIGLCKRPVLATLIFAREYTDENAIFDRNGCSVNQIDRF